MSQQHNIKAIVFGSTGATGSVLTHQLVKNPNVSLVTAVTRKHIVNIHQRFGLNNTDSKLQQLVIDYDNIDDNAKKTIQQHDTAFCTLGTTRANAGSAEAFRHIDHDYVINAAKASEGSIKHFIYQSSQGANKNSFLLYSQTKGQIENDLQHSTNIDKITIVRPGLLLTNRHEKRTGEHIAQLIYPTISIIFPDEYKSVDTRSVAAAMINAAFNDTNRTDRFRIISNGECVKTKWPADADWRLS